MFNKQTEGEIQNEVLFIWKGNRSSLSCYCQAPAATGRAIAKVIPLLADTYHVLCVSYDGFDKTEETEFTTMLEETEKIENYIREHFSGHIRAAYGCSLGGSFVGLLTARKKIHIDYGILKCSAAHGHILRSEAVEISFTLTLLRLCPMELM